MTSPNTLARERMENEREKEKEMSMMLKHFGARLIPRQKDDSGHHESSKCSSPAIKAQTYVRLTRVGVLHVEGFRMRGDP